MGVRREGEPRGGGSASEEFFSFSRYSGRAQRRGGLEGLVEASRGIVVADRGHGPPKVCVWASLGSPEARGQARLIQNSSIPWAAGADGWRKSPW